MHNPLPKENYLCLFGEDPRSDAATPSKAETNPEPSFACLFGPSGFFLRGNHFAFGPDWYLTVGVSICFTLFIQLCTRALLPWVGLAIVRAKRRWQWRAQPTLEAMKQLFTGPECALSMKLGKLHAFFAIAIIFSSLLPLLFLFLFLYSILAYAVDKFLFLRLYRSPPPYSHTLISTTLWWVKYACALKLLLGWCAPCRAMGFTGSRVMFM